jgi:hypothetical protein
MSRFVRLLIRAPCLWANCRLPTPRDGQSAAKAAVVTAVRRGEITLEEALRRYQLSEEEFFSWQRAFETHGLPGLRASRVQQYRNPRYRRQQPYSRGNDRERITNARQVAEAPFTSKRPISEPSS